MVKEQVVYLESTNVVEVRPLCTTVLMKMIYDYLVVMKKIQELFVKVRIKFLHDHFINTVMLDIPPVNVTPST